MAGTTTTATSLARQLKKLAAPQTTLLKQDKRKPSLLFDPREAASLDRDVVYEIGLSGLEELEKVDERFSEFRDNLFSPSSKSFERSVQTSEVNRSTDEKIERFLLMVSPFFQLRSAHKALEWLVCRHHVHQFNVDPWILCALPYHETNAFVRAVQLVYLKDEAGKWHWLRPIQKPGIPLPKSTLLNRCGRDAGLLKLICSQLDASVRLHSARPSALSAIIAFYTTTVIGALEHLGKAVTEDQLAALMPSLLAGLAGRPLSCPDRTAGSYMIVAQLTRKAKLSPKALQEIFGAIVKGMTPALTVEAVTVLSVLLAGHDGELPVAGLARRKVVKSLAAKPQLIPAVEALAAGYSVAPFVSPLIVSALLELSGAGSDELTAVPEGRAGQLSSFLQKLVDEVRFRGPDASAVIRAYLTGYLTALEDGLKADNVRQKFRSAVKPMLDRLERQYPLEFERCLHLALNEASDGRKEEVRTLFGANWDVDHTALFLKVNHSSAEVRADAMASVVQALIHGKVRNLSFAVSAVSERLTDSNPAVVSQVLRLSDRLAKILPAGKQIGLLMAALRNADGQPGSPKGWNGVRATLVRLVCGPSFAEGFLEGDEAKVDLFAALLPHLIPADADEVRVMKAAVHSAFGSTSPLLVALSKIELEDETPGPAMTGAFQAVLSREKPFGTQQLNLKLFEAILARLAGQDTSPRWTLNALMVVPALIRSESGSTESVRMATRFMAALRGLLGASKARPVARKEEEMDADLKVKDRIHCHVIQAHRMGALSPDALLFAAMEALDCVNVDTADWAKRQWAKEEDGQLIFLLALFRFLLSGLTLKSARTAAQFRTSLQALFEEAGSAQAKIFFLGLAWNETDTPEALRAVALKMAGRLLPSVGDWAVQLSSFVVPRLICCLSSPDQGVRREALAAFEALLGQGAKGFSGLVTEICSSSQEILIDPDQLKAVLLRHFPSPASKSYPALTALLDSVLSPQVPDNVKEGLLRALDRVNSVGILTKLLPLLDRMMEEGGQTEGRPFSPARSGVITALLERFSVESAPILVAPDGWKSFRDGLRCSTCFIRPSGGDEAILLSPQDILIEAITSDLFRAVGTGGHQAQLAIFSELLDIICGTDKAVTARQARHALKRISFDAALVAQLLDFKPDPSSLPPTGRQLRSGLSRNRQAGGPKPSRSPEAWGRILAVLEVLQSKKRMDSVQLLIAPLFGLLKSCLDEDEEQQAALEYSKQLILSSLLSVCQKLPQGSQPDSFNTGLVVQCVRVSSNPQTHHQALLLLSLAAQLFPSHVLHNIMAIFTFMGTSVLRQDDAYSFQVIAKTLESVIPTLIEASSRTAVEPVVTTVMHVFADALPDVPEHRRLPVFDKLLSTLDPAVYLWLAPALILSNMASQGPRLAGPAKEGDQTVPDVEFCLSLCHLYPPDVQLNACVRLLDYLRSLPAEKEEKMTRMSRTGPASAGGRDSVAEGSAPFDLDGPSTTTRQLCHYKLLLAGFVAQLLASDRLVGRLAEELDESERAGLEPLYQRLLSAALEATQSASKWAEAKQSSAVPNLKFWKALLHRCYDVIDRINSLLPRRMFISAVDSLLSHAIPSIRRRAMELLGAKLQHHHAHQSGGFFSALDEEDQGALLRLVAKLTDIARDGLGGSGGAGPARLASTEEGALNQQTALFTLKLLARQLCPTHPDAFRPVLEVVVGLISSSSPPSSGGGSNALASAFLCLAELVGQMGVQSLPALPRYGSQLVARLQDLTAPGQQKETARNDLLVLSLVTAVWKLVETLPQFLVPYLGPILRQVCHLSAKHQHQPGTDATKPGQLQSRLQSIRTSLAGSSVPRSLVSSVGQVYAELTTDSDDGTFRPSPAVGPLMAILSDSFASMSRDELAAQLPNLTALFIKALDARSLAPEGADVEAVEEPVVSALVSLVLKLSESSFRPLFFQLYDWATTRAAGHKERLVTFYVATSRIADKLKGLFVAFAGHFIRNAAQVVADTNDAVKEDGRSVKMDLSAPNAIRLLESVLRVLHRVCLHDNENFMNKERFETLMEPLVDQLDSQLGGPEAAKGRVKSLLVPLLAQMAVAAGDDYLWKALHYQLLLKTRSNSTHVRLGSLDALSALVEKLGEDYLALLPEAIPFLAELLEDDVQEVELAAQSTIAHMEGVLGEPLQKYF